MESNEEGRSVRDFLRSWAWKREHLSDRERFRRPYVHKLKTVNGQEVILTIKQARFMQEGFASTIWDSSIVMAKFFEKWSHKIHGKHCLDLSAGCGLVGIALARLGANVTCTDLPPNLPLLKENCESNAQGLIEVEPHSWGEDPCNLDGPFDVVVACDVMYVREGIKPLINTLEKVSSGNTDMYVCHGRNNGAEDYFLEECKGRFLAEHVDRSELDDVYQSDEIVTLRLRKHTTV